MRNLFKKLMKDERGLSTMEYAVLFVIIVVGAVAAWGTLGDDLLTNIEDGTDTFTGELSEHQN
jgi:Flp pilus assembly pilin Flp